ncbi:MAG TPA: porin family protein [Chryseosolibacter sp.]|nr:porin family protein [Chryseosolibacter sp.]
MKNKLLLALALLCVSVLPALAQAEFAIGIKAGPNFANINTDASAGENYKSRTGFHGGAFALVKLTKIGIQPEVIFSQQGSTVSFNNEDLHANYSYLNIPIIVKLYLAAGLNLQVGPQFGFVTKADQEFVDDLGNISKENIKDEMKKSDISAALGAGWDLPFGLTIDARYNLGLSKLYDGDGAPEAKNQVFQLSLGYKLFKFGK